MDEELFRWIATGLLGVIVLLLFVALSQLSRIRGTLRAASTPGTEAAPEESVATEEATEEQIASQPELAGAEPEPEQASSQPAEVADTVTEDTVAAFRAETTPAADAGTELGPDEEGPYERDGRWWFRRGEQELVYDEQQEQWVDPTTSPAAEAQPVTPTAADATVTTPTSTAADATVITPTSGAGEQSAITQTPPADESFGTLEADAPRGVVEPEPHPLEEARGWDAPRSNTPIVEPVSPPEPITEEGTGEARPGTAGHWKCPACGVINGSTASSCRMCFAARP